MAGGGRSAQQGVRVCVLVKPKANIDRQSQMQKEQERETGGREREGKRAKHLK